MTAYVVNGINLLCFGGLCKEQMLHWEFCYYSVLFWPFLVPGWVCIPTGLLWAIWSEQPCLSLNILAQSVVLPPITVTQFLSYSFLRAVGTPTVENTRKCQSNTPKYHVDFTYWTPHKLRTLIPANAIEVFQKNWSFPLAAMAANPPHFWSGLWEFQIRNQSYTAAPAFPSPRSLQIRISNLALAFC